MEFQIRIGMPIGCAVILNMRFCGAQSDDFSDLGGTREVARGVKREKVEDLR